MSTYQTVCDELQLLRAQFATEQRDLASINANYEQLCRASVDDENAALEAATLPTQREMIKARIHGLGMRIAEVEAIKTELEIPMLAAAERERQEDAKAKWEGIRTQYIKARDEFDELKAKLELATATAKGAQEAFTAAMDELTQFRAQPYDPVDFSPAELASARRRDAKLEKAVRDALAEREQALAAQGGIRRQLLDVGADLARFAWQERNYRPPEIREAATATTLGEVLSQR